MRRSLLMLVLAGGACVAQGARAQVPPAVERGSAVAQRACSRCHAVALEPASREPDAPPFRVLSRVYSAADLETKLTSISADGHFEMPRVSLAEEEISDVAAYIASLEPAEDRAPATPRRGPKAPARSHSRPTPLHTAAIRNSERHCFATRR